MKVIIAEGETTPIYPCLMKSKGGLVVLFSRKGEGQVIGIERDEEGKDTDLGCYYSNWDMNCFSPFKGTITITQ
jgi:hypothetical protein